MTKLMPFRSARDLSIGEIATLAGAEVRADAPLDRRIHDIAPLELAGPGDLVFFENVSYRDRLRLTRADACLVAPRLESEVPASVTVLQVSEPFSAFIKVATSLFPDSLRPPSWVDSSGVVAGAFVHPTARLEDGVTVEPGAVIGARAEIGAGTVIGPNAVIGPDVRIGRDGVIAAMTSVTHALIGDRVIIHPGCRIGQDGFGYRALAGRHRKIPQLGRVIIQDDVEIGAGSTIDRGAMSDTVIGEGTKIDNLVQIGHNVTIGRHCIVVAQTGISGSTTLEDWVTVGGQVGISDHLTIGERARVGSSSGVMHNVPAGSTWVGVPARPTREFFREVATLRRLATPSSEEKPDKDSNPGSAT
jgi:UDP-3-O-[3-hydroxymyristoyl] glucosamine N-acyltransferase